MLDAQPAAIAPARPPAIQPLHPSPEIADTTGVRSKPAALLATATALLPELEAGRALDAKTLREAMSAAFGANDTQGGQANARLHHPTLRWEPHGKTTRGGRQTARLPEADLGPWGEFVARLRAAIDEVLAGLAIMAHHPHFFRIPADYDLSLWATVLHSDGHQLPHIHPNGWLSGVSYVAVPEVISEDRRDQAGWLEIGCRAIPALGDQPSKTVRPEPGLLVLFPSYTFHRTLPFSSDAPRISVAFDVEPRSYRT